MKRTATRAVLALITALLTLTACSAGAQPRPSVVVTTNILGDITRQIVGDEVPVSVLMTPGADPHSFGISAQQAAELEQADLVVHNGLGLEEGEDHVAPAEHQRPDAEEAVEDGQGVARDGPADQGQAEEEHEQRHEAGRAHTPADPGWRAQSRDGTDILQEFPNVAAYVARAESDWDPRVVNAGAS